MKFFLLLVAVGVLFWLLRGSLRRARPPQAGKTGKPGATGASGAGGDSGDSVDSVEPQAMLQCAQCGLHLPRDEALPGQGGVFCGEAHRSAFEAAHRAP